MCLVAQLGPNGLGAGRAECGNLGAGQVDASSNGVIFLGPFFLLARLRDHHAGPTMSPFANAPATSGLDLGSKKRRPWLIVLVG